MTDQDVSGRVFELLKAFREGQIRRHFGMLIDEPETIDAGMTQADDAAMELKALAPQGLCALEPLLDDANAGVRSGAADLLMYVMPEQARPVLETLAKSAHIEAGRTARLALRVHRWEAEG